MDFLQKWKEFSVKMNEKGIPMPMIRDPKSGASSVSLTMMVISFNFCLIAMAGKWSKFFDGIDPSQAINLFMVCTGLYFGRKFQSDGKKATLEEDPEIKK
jgi:hypothetical protein